MYAYVIYIIAYKAALILDGKNMDLYLQETVEYMNSSSSQLWLLSAENSAFCIACLGVLHLLHCGSQFSHPVCKALRLTRDISCCYLLSANNSKINLGYACQYSRSLPPSCFLYELHSHQTWLFETFVTCWLSHKAKAGWDTVANISSLFSCCFSHLTLFCSACTYSLGCFLVHGDDEVQGLIKVILP